MCFGFLFQLDQGICPSNGHISLQQDFYNLFKQVLKNLKDFLDNRFLHLPNFLAPLREDIFCVLNKISLIENINKRKLSLQIEWFFKKIGFVNIGVDHSCCPSQEDLLI